MKDPMKSISLVPKTIPGVGGSCRARVGHAGLGWGGVGWVMQGWGGVGHEGVGVWWGGS